jgi:putative transposase
MIDKTAALSVVKQCERLDLNRSSLYYEPVAAQPEELALMRLLDELHLKLPFAPSRRMVSELGIEILSNLVYEVSGSML